MMEMVWLRTLGAVFVVSAIPLSGLLALAVSQRGLDNAMQYLVSFAVGGLLGGAMIHLIPEAFTEFGPGLAMPLAVLGGFIGFFLLEKFFWAHEHNHHARGGVRPLALLNLVGDGVHNLVDGAIIAASFSVDPGLGLSTTIAVALHEIPQEIGDFGVLVFSGLSVRRAVLFNVLSGVTAIVGAVATLVVGEHVGGVTRTLLPVAAGGFLYIAASDLIPELHRRKRLADTIWQVTCIGVGIGLMCLTALFE